MRLKNYVLIIILLLLKQQSAIADLPDKGRPFTQYYAPNDYRAGSSTSNVVRDSLGVFYFSNDEGVLLFDGVNWDLIPIKDNKPVYWVEIDKNGTLLVASTGEIGYLDYLPNGQKVYKSLLENDDDNQFENVWEIAVTSKEAIFRSQKLLIHYQNGVINTIETEGNGFDVSFTVKDTIYTRIRGKGLFYVSDGKLFPVLGGEYFANIKLNSYLPYDDKLLIGTRNGALFLLAKGIVNPFLTEADEFLKKYKLYDGCITPSGNYAYSAILKGVVIIDKTGKLLQILDETSGLPQHQYLFVEVADHTSLWMTHAVGISRAEILSPVSYFDKTFGIQGVVTDIKVYDKQLYITTLKGFYQYKKDEHEFTKINQKFVQEFQGITATLNHIYVGGQDGLLKLESGRLKEIMPNMIHEMEVSLDEKLLYVGSGEGGFSVININSDNYQTLKVDGFSEQIKKIIPFKNKAILVTHSGHLVFVNISYDGDRLTANITKNISISSFDAVKSGENLLIIKPDKWIIYSSKGDKIHESKLPVSNSLTKIQLTSNLIDNTFWVCYRDEKRIDYCDQWVLEDDTLISANRKFKPGYKINAIFRAPDGIDWFGGDEGIIRYDSEFNLQDLDASLACHISTAVVNSDSIISNYEIHADEIILPYESTSIQLNFYSDQSFSAKGEIQFQYKLKGLNNNWSAWTSKTSKEYSNLNPKAYTFQVRAKNGFGKISNIASINFSISPPWYLSIYAIIVYGILAILIIYGFIYWRTSNLKKAKVSLEKIVEGRTVEIVKQKQSLEEHAESLRQANNTKNQLFSIIGHDLRSPLNSIQGLTDLIKHYRTEKQPEKVGELVNHMGNSVKLLSHLLDNLLSWALNESGNFKIKKKPIKLYYLINEVVGILKEAAKSKSIHLEMTVDKDLSITADSNSLGTIIRNLVSNAIKFTHEHGNIWISATSNENYVSIEIQDDGIGIPKDKLTEIFQLTSTTYGTSNEKGTGLGLVLVENFVALNDGKMTVESEDGEGTTFLLTFPR